MPGDDQSRWGALFTIGFETLAGVLLGLAVGHWVDKHYDWSPWGTIVGTLVGTVAGMYLMIREGIRVNRDPPKDRGPDGRM